MNQETTKHRWQFHRIGGLDQVVLSSADDLRHLAELDPKLWVALSCPADGLEFDQRILALLDADADGHIRVPEVIEATTWVCERLSNLDGLLQASDTLTLESINTDHEEGKRLLATAHAIIKAQGQAEKDSVSEQEVVQASEQASQALFNGDGVFPPLAELDDEIQAFVQDALSVMGGVADVSTQPGVNFEIADAFVQTLANWREWRGGLGDASSVLGEQTPKAWSLMQAIKNKMDDYFLRADLASYAPQAEVALNVSEKSLVSAENGLLAQSDLEALPLSKIESSKPLDLTAGLNPVWRSQVEAFAALVQPLLKVPEQMTRQEWLDIQKALESYAKVVASEPKSVPCPVEVAPTMSLSQLGEERIDAILQSDLLQRFKAMTEKDAQTPVAATDIAALERLVVYHTHLYRLLMNFVSFHDFFTLDGMPAAFQAGHLYIDGRRCDLCVPVKNADQHAVLAAYTELFLLYCECTRQATPGAAKETKNIVAAVTMGRSDLLMEGRNGVYIDNKGDDWDAKVIKVIEKPISLRQAIWAPYKRVGKLVSEQINKWAASKDNAVAQASASKVEALSSGAAPAADSTPKFDIGRNVGIFAAIGLALGALGTAVGSIARALFDMQWWQFPLLILGLFLLISGPSLVLAWLKLRQRTLGPLLESSGWAVNGQIKISYALGGQLTSEAQLPPNAKRNLTDPLKDKSRAGLWVFIIALLVGALAVGGWLWYQHRMAELVLDAEAPAAQVEVAPKTEESPVIIEEEPAAEEVAEPEAVAETAEEGA